VLKRGLKFLARNFKPFYEHVSSLCENEVIQVQNHRCTSAVYGFCKCIELRICIYIFIYIFPWIYTFISMFLCIYSFIYIVEVKVASVEVEVVPPSWLIGAHDIAIKLNEYIRAGRQ
jgi:hypothetical protein